MAAKSITQKLVDALPLLHPNQKQIILRDSSLKGFGLRLTAGGASFIVEARVKGKNKRLTLGKADLISVEAARKQAVQMLAQMSSGVDPKAKQKTSELEKITLAEVLDNYLSHKKLRPTYIKGLKGELTRHFADWFEKPLTSITGDMVLARHQKLGFVGHHTANSAIKRIRTLFNFAINSLELEVENPVQKMNKTRAWFKVSRNASVIPDHMLPGWYQGVLSLNRPDVRDWILLLLLSGLRRTEALMLKWENIDMEARILTIPAEISKNHEKHELPLSDALLDLLAQRRVRCKNSRWVFPHQRGTADQHMANPQHALKQVADRSGCDFSPHILRRTFASLAARVGILHQTIRKLLNHSQRLDLTCQYILIGTEAMRAPMQQISEKFLELMGADSNWLAEPSHKYTRVSKIPILAELVNDYLLTNKLRMQTQTNYEKCVRVDFGDWYGLPVKQITAAMVAQRNESLLATKASSTIAR